MRIAERSLLGAVAAGLMASALLPPGPAVFALVAVLTGMPLALRLSRRWDVVEFLSVSVALSLVVFALLTPLAYALGVKPALRFAPAALPVLSVMATRRARCHRFTIRLATTAFALVVAFAAVSVALRNGPWTAGGAPTYEARSWYGRDTFYLFALVESYRSHEAPPPDNPFLAGVANAYPTALHGALAGMLGSDPRPAAVALARPFALFLVASGGLLAACTRRRRRVRGELLVLLGALGVFLIRPDFFVYPQTQPLALLLFLLLLWCLGTRPALTPPRRFVPVFFLGTGLVFAHAVTAGVGIALLGAAALSLAIARRTARAAAFGTVALGAAALFLIANRAPVSSLAGGTLDADAVALLVRYGTAWILPMMALLLLLLAGRRGPRALLVATCGVLALGIVYTVFGVSRENAIERWFVIFNAQRFFLFALILALPLLTPVRWRISLVAAALLLAGALAMRGEVARDTWLLVREAPLVISPARMEALAAVRRLTPANARFATTARDHALPALAGRAQFVNDRWNLWGMNTIAARDFALRLAAADRWLGEMTPEQRAGLFERFGITHLMLDGHWPDDESATRWVARNLPPETARVLFRNGEALVLQRVTPER